MSDKGMNLFFGAFDRYPYICEIFSRKIYNYMRKSRWIVPVIMALGFSSCSNEVDLTGDYVDTPVIYSLLNPDDTTHYIRIQKAFLVNGNVLQTAQTPDSLKYDPADLDVKIQAIDANTGNIPPNTPPITFTLVQGAIKDSGIFASDGFMLFKSNAPLNDLRRYRLQITNTKLNKVISSETGLVYSPSVNGILKNPSPTNAQQTISFNPTSGTGFTIRWITAQNGIVYQPEVIFKWTEVDLTTLAATPDSNVWKLIPKEATNNDVGVEMDFNLPQNSFFRHLGETVPVKPNIKRVIGKVTFRIYVGTEELNTYINVNKPTIGLIQDKPVYTNIENGLGLFAGRSTFKSLEYNLSLQNQDTLINNVFTKDLNFKKN